MQLISVRMAFRVEPKSVVEPGGVHHQRVAVPGAYGIAVPTRPSVGFRRVRTPVDKDLAIAVNIALEEDEHVGGLLDDSPRIRSHARHAGRQATSVPSSLG